MVQRASKCQFRVDSFDVKLEEDRLLVFPLNRCESPAEANREFRESFAPWALAFELKTGHPFDLTYARPVLLGEQGRRKLGPGFTRGSNVVSFSTLPKHFEFPWPPSRDIKKVGPIAEDMWDAWRGRRRDTWALTSRAYYCLTVIERQLGGALGRAKRKKVGKECLNVHPDVMDYIGALTERERKDTGADPLSAEERRQIEFIIGELILRVAAYESGVCPGEWLTSHRVTASPEL